MTLPPEIEEAFKELVGHTSYGIFRPTYDVMFQRLYAKIGISFLADLEAMWKSNDGVSFFECSEQMEAELQEMLDELP